MITAVLPRVPAPWRADGSGTDAGPAVRVRPGRRLRQAGVGNLGLFEATVETAGGDSFRAIVKRTAKPAEIAVFRHLLTEVAPEAMAPLIPRPHALTDCGTYHEVTMDWIDCADRDSRWSDYDPEAIATQLHGLGRLLSGLPRSEPFVRDTRSRTVAFLEQRLQLSSAVGRLLRRIRAWTRRAPAPVLCHNDPHISNWEIPRPGAFPRLIDLGNCCYLPAGSDLSILIKARHRRKVTPEFVTAAVVCYSGMAGLDVRKVWVAARLDLAHKGARAAMREVDPTEQLRKIKATLRMLV